MQRPNKSTRVSIGAIAGALPIRAGMTLLEMVIAMAIVVVILTAILPAFRSIRNSWDAKQAAAETLQNSRVLMDHLNYNLSKAVAITDVSDSTETNGYIQFEDNDANEWRYEVDDSNLVEFGLVGSLYELAGPVSQLQFTCYDGNDFENPTTDVNSIRFVDVNATLTNSATLGQDKFFTTSVYLRVGQEGSSDCGLVGWWKLDETSGTTAEDSSGNDNNGTLVNYMSPTWVTGQIGGALDFDGWNDYVSLPIGSVINSLTNCTIATWVYWSWDSSWQRIWDFGTGTTYYMFLTPRNSYNDRMRFAITRSGAGGEEQTTAPSALPNGWHHVTVTIDADNHTHKLYLDGSPVAQNTSGYREPDDLGNTNRNWLGRSQYSADPYFDGRLDDVRIYSRVLEADEIAQLALDSVLIYEEFTEEKVDSDDTSITITTPDTDEGDLLIAAVATDGDTSSSLAPPGGEGWTEIDIDDYSNDVTLGAWWKLADASESSSHQFAWSGAEQAYGWMMRFTGHDSTNPINDYSASGWLSATPTSPAVTTTVDNCLILRLGAFDDDDITVDDTGLNGGHIDITMDKSAGSTGVPVGWWKLDDASGTTAVDSSGNGNNGTLVNMYPPTDWVTGWIDGALDFDGWNDYVNCGNDSSLRITSRITVAAWVKTRDCGDNSHNPYVIKGDHAYALQQGWNNYIEFFIYDGDWYAAMYHVTGSFNNVWHHLAGTYNGSQVKLYVDGVLRDTTNHTGSIANTAYNVQLGKCAEETDRLYNGVLDDVRIYNSALDDDEVEELAEGGGGGGGDGTVSGGAGYVMQSSSGSSGISNFSLGSSNEAQMLTIAIAPNSDTGCTGSGSIQP